VRYVLLVVVLLGCTPANAGEAERKHNVTWLSQHPSSEAVGALGRLADDDKAAEAALEAMANVTRAGGTLAGGASALDVYLAAWVAVERNAAWGTAMMKRALGDHARMNDAASAITRGSPKVLAFVNDLDGALRSGCDVGCGSARASAKGDDALKLITSRLADDRTREAMCDGLGSLDSSREARAVFMRVPDSSRNAPGCLGAAARMAAHDDDVLAWLAKTAEPGLLRATGAAEALPCDRTAQLWSMALASRDHNVYGALVIPLGASVKRCPKALDGMLSGAIVGDVDGSAAGGTSRTPNVDAQALAVSALGSSDGNIVDLVATCTALPNVQRGAANAQTKARAEEVRARCKR
jgi:hypothetical protein